MVTYSQVSHLGVCGKNVAKSDGLYFSNHHFSIIFLMHIAIWGCALFSIKPIQKYNLLIEHGSLDNSVISQFVMFDEYISPIISIWLVKSTQKSH